MAFVVAVKVLEGSTCIEKREWQFERGTSVTLTLGNDYGSGTFPQISALPRRGLLWKKMRRLNQQELGLGGVEGALQGKA